MSAEAATTFEDICTLVQTEIDALSKQEPVTPELYKRAADRIICNHILTESQVRYALSDGVAHFMWRTRERE